ncbi:MAG TPA: 3-isopropylmalate dehydratase, partial [Methanobacterium sp.]
RIFYRNAINVGLPLLESEKISSNFNQGDEIELNMDEGILKDEKTGEEYEVKKLPEFMLEILNNGGLIPYLKEKLRKKPKN